MENTDTDTTATTTTITSDEVSTSCALHVCREIENAHALIGLIGTRRDACGTWDDKAGNPAFFGVSVAEAAPFESGAVPDSLKDKWADLLVDGIVEPMTPTEDGYVMVVSSVLASR